MSLPAAFRAEVERVVGAAGVVSELEQLRTYECDALTGHRAIEPAISLLAEERARAGGLHGV